MNKSTSFLKLIKANIICIPKIQRDYAQGRLDEKTKAIRTGFLNSIIKALTIDEKPLNLDFVYGSRKDGIFTPLDGQQRLTTLFLLHWYLMPKGENLLATDSSSRFSYVTRISSEDFCNALVKCSCETLLEQLEHFKVSLSELIEDQSWFMHTWKKDPTVRAMLVMLDALHNAMHKKIASKDTHAFSRQTMWDKLNKGKDSALVFHLLDRDEFNLTDELYVKMNARGKELSAFDFFKSTLEEQMLLNKVEDEDNTWKNNIDNKWINLFWNAKAKPKLKDMVDKNSLDELKNQQNIINEVEGTYLSFFERIIAFHLFTADKKFDDLKIGDNLVHGPATRLKLMPMLCERNFFDASFFEFTNTSFESLIYEKEHEIHDASILIENIYFEQVEGNTLFEAFINDNSTIFSFETRIQFYAFLQFLKYNTADAIHKDNGLKEELSSWMRIIRNIFTQSNAPLVEGFARYDVKWFEKSLKPIQALAKEIYEDKTHSSILDFFNQNDFNALKNLMNNHTFPIKDFIFGEEIIKANLMMQENVDADAWKTAIIKAENHPYFSGQIRFLLEWSKDGDNYNLEKFNRYFAQISQCFGEGMFSSDYYIFNCALMLCTEISEENLYWTHKYGNYNRFIKAKDKKLEYSWKTHLRECDKSPIKLMLDEWWEFQNQSESSSSDGEYKNSFTLEKFEDFYDKLKINKSIKDWRKYFIYNRKMYDCMKMGKFGYWDPTNGGVTLVGNLDNRSTLRELRTYYWSEKYTTGNYLSGNEKENSYKAIFGKDEKEISVQYVNIDGKNIYRLCLHESILDEVEKIEDEQIPNIIQKYEDGRCEIDFMLTQENSDKIEAVLEAILISK